MKDLEHGELDVRVNYIKVGQWAIQARYYLDKITQHLDEGAIKINGKRLERRAGVDRRNGENTQDRRH